MWKTIQDTGPLLLLLKHASFSSGDITFWFSLNSSDPFASSPPLLRGLIVLQGSGLSHFALSEWPHQQNDFTYHLFTEELPNLYLWFWPSPESQTCPTKRTFLNLHWDAVLDVFRIPLQIHSPSISFLFCVLSLRLTMMDSIAKLSFFRPPVGLAQWEALAWVGR